MTHLENWSARSRYALAHPIRSAYKGAMWARQQASSAVFKFMAAILFRWGHKLGVPGNLRHKIYWKAGRRDIVPLPQLYDFLSQERAVGQYYPNAPQWSSRSQTILNALGHRISKDDSILEIGCNLGRNLNHLWQAGYRHLYGMEISEHAVRRMRVAYPALADVRVDIGPAELSIKNYATKSIDVIITMATLEEVHPQSRYLFDEIARVVRKYVLAIEPKEGHRSHMQYPWDIPAEFSRVGLSLIESKPWSSLWPGELAPTNEWAEDMHPFYAFLFQVAA
jgi:SAM-dependent methyltransferase